MPCHRGVEMFQQGLKFIIELLPVLLQADSASEVVGYRTIINF